MGTGYNGECDYCKGEYCDSCRHESQGGGNPTFHRSQQGLPFRGDSRVGVDKSRLGYLGDNAGSMGFRR